jgi:hypothetical protein
MLTELTDKIWSTKFDSEIRCELDVTSLASRLAFHLSSEPHLPPHLGDERVAVARGIIHPSAVKRRLAARAAAAPSRAVAAERAFPLRAIHGVQNLARLERRVDAPLGIAGDVTTHRRGRLHLERLLDRRRGRGGGGVLDRRALLRRLRREREEGGRTRERRASYGDRRGTGVSIASRRRRTVARWYAAVAALFIAAATLDAICALPAIASSSDGVGCVVARSERSNPAGSASGSFYTSERRGGVERRQLELKGVAGGD